MRTLSRTSPLVWTAEMSGEFDRLHAAWRAIQYSTANTDRSQAEFGLKQAYSVSGLSSPDITWCKGPNELAECWQKGRDGQFGVSVKNVIVDQQRELAYGGLNACVPSAIWSRVAIAFSRLTADSNAEAIWEGVSRLADQGRPFLWHRIVQRLRRRQYAGNPTALYARDGWFGQFDCVWLGIHEYFSKIDKSFARYVDNLSGLSIAMRNSGWIVPYTRRCFLCERPHTLSLQEGLLHSASGPALQYPDGWTLYAWKGVGLQSLPIENREQISYRYVAAQRSAAVRRCLIEIVTPERFVHMAKAKRDSEDDTGVLWRAVFGDGDVWSAVEVVNGTPEPDGSYKHYFLHVPSDLRTAREAVAWTYGLSGSQYARLRMRT